jgi:hypothetical protein
MGVGSGGVKRHKAVTHARLDASLSDFVGVPGYVGAVCKVDELRADMDRFARMLLGYDWAG